MRMRPVRHFSRALHQVSVCLMTSARVRRYGRRHVYVTTYCCRERSRRAYCPSKSWLTRTNATGRNDLQTAKTLIPRKKSCSRYATIDDFSCTETQADGVIFRRHSEKTFFLFEMSRTSKTTTKFSARRARGRARLFFLFIYLLFIYLFHLFH
jgi:hypothetical protein